MIVSDMGQARVFVINILFGIICVVLFDIFSILVKRYGKSVVVINLFDCIFFALAFALVFFAGAKFNLGAFRYYQVFGLLIGILLHWTVFSKLERKMLAVLFNVGSKSFKIIARAIWLPCLLVLKLILTPIAYVETKAISAAERLEKKAKKVKLKHEKKKKTVKKRIKMI